MNKRISWALQCRQRYYAQLKKIHDHHPAPIVAAAYLRHCHELCMRDLTRGMGHEDLAALDQSPVLGRAA